MPWFTALPFLHLINFSVCNVYHSARFEKDTRYYALYLQPADLTQASRPLF